MTALSTLVGQPVAACRPRSLHTGVKVWPTPGWQAAAAAVSVARGRGVRVGGIGVGEAAIRVTVGGTLAVGTTPVAAGGATLAAAVGGTLATAAGTRDGER